LERSEPDPFSLDTLRIGGLLCKKLRKDKSLLAGLRLEDPKIVMITPWDSQELRVLALFRNS